MWQGLESWLIYLQIIIDSYGKNKRDISLHTGSNSRVKRWLWLYNSSKYSQQGPFPSGKVSHDMHMPNQGRTQ